MAEKLYLVLYELSRLILMFTLINLLWIIVDLPFFIVLIQVILTTDTSHLYVLLPLLSLLLPLFFFPGTHALISSSRALVKEESNVDLFTFFYFYKGGFKRSFLIGMFFTSVTTLLGMGLYTVYQSSLILSLIIIVLFFYLSIIVFYLLYLDVHFNMPMGWVVKQTLIFVIQHPLFALTNFIVLIALHYIMYSVSFILFVLFGTTLTVYATFYLFMRKLTKIKARTL